MKTKTKLLLITIALLLIIGILTYQNIKATGEIVLINENKVSQDGSYCEYNIITDICGPEGVCDFQTDNEGTKVCLGKY